MNPSRLVAMNTDAFIYTEEESRSRKTGLARAPSLANRPRTRQYTTERVQLVRPVLLDLISCLAVRQRRVLHGDRALRLSLGGESYGDDRAIIPIESHRFRGGSGAYIDPYAIQPATAPARVRPPIGQCQHLPAERA